MVFLQHSLRPSFSVMAKGVTLLSRFLMAISGGGSGVSIFFVLSGFLITRQDSILNLGNISFANRLGKYTYGIYLIHPIVLTFIDVALRVGHIQSTISVMILCRGVAGFFRTLILNWLSYEVFESRFLALKERFAVIKSGLKTGPG